MSHVETKESCGDVTTSIKEISVTERLEGLKKHYQKKLQEIDDLLAYAKASPENERIVKISWHLF